MFCVFIMWDFYTNIVVVLVCYIAFFEPSHNFIYLNNEPISTYLKKVSSHIIILHHHVLVTLVNMTRILLLYKQ